mmetsp:Transcript_3249/g.12387  ORF Transcript_3249/g.12387 Transcript_3249/m.12387 type:complete len:1270 (-) Transcript_3249:1730-5539(-)
MASTTNLQTHLKWIQDTPYTQQSSRFEYGLDLKSTFAERPIEFEKYGENMKTPPKDLRDRIRDTNSPSVQKTTQRKRIGKIEYGIENYSVPQQSSSNITTITLAAQQRPSAQAPSLPPQRNVSPSSPLPSSSSAIRSAGRRLHIKRKRDSPETSVSAIDLTQDNGDMARPKKVQRNSSFDDNSSHHSGPFRSDDDFGAELDDLIGGSSSLNMATTTSAPSASNNTSTNKSHVSNKKKRLVFAIPSQQHRASSTRPSVEHSPPSPNMPPPQTSVPKSTTTTISSHNPPQLSRSRSLPPAVKEQIYTANSAQTRPSHSTNTFASTPAQSSINTDRILSHLNKEKVLQDALFEHISDAVKELKTLALTVPNAKRLLGTLFKVRNDMESKMFDVSVVREEIVRELKDAPQGSSFGSSGETTQSLMDTPQHSPLRNHVHDMSDYYSAQQIHHSANTIDNYADNGPTTDYPPPPSDNGNMNQHHSSYNDNYPGNGNHPTSGNDYSGRGDFGINAGMDDYNANFSGGDNYSGDWNNHPSDGQSSNSLNFSNYNPRNAAVRGNVDPRIYKERNFSWSSHIERQLKNKFAIQTGFRSLQLDAINATMDGRDVFVVMPTGGGKSLTYQLPASMSGGVTVVVSPLLSLIQDQVQEMQQLGVSTTFLSGESQWEEQLSIYRELESSSPPFRLLYVTPEKISQSNSFQGVLIRMAQNGALDRFVIDEAHCISKWGNHFRVDYRNLSQLKEKFPDIPVLALTATATDQVQEDILQQLRMTNCVRLKSSFNRENLVYTVKKKSSHIVEDIIDFLGKYNLKKESGIVYCLSKKDCENVAQALSDNGLDAEVYHADHPHKKKNHEDWKRGTVNIIVATIAFGMGINKPDVRFVIHHSMPKTIEDYYQESGRAGRDGLESHCLLFYAKKDVIRLIRLVAGSGMENGQFDFDKVDFAGLNAMMDYCLCECECRRVLLLNHFGETDFDKKDCKEKCDICKSGVTMVDQDVTNYAVNVLEIIQEVRSTTEVNLVKYARGLKMGKGGFFKESEKLKNLQSSCEGISKSQLETIVRYLTLRGYLRQEGRTTKTNMVYELLTLGREADRLLRQRERFRIPVASSEGTRKRNFTTLFKQIPSDNVSKEVAEFKEKRERLIHELYIVRTKLCHENGLPPYLVTGQVSLDDMADKMPKTVAELKNVTLFAKEKIRNYGIPYLRVIRQFCAENFHNCTPLSHKEIQEMEREISALFTDENPVVIQTPQKPMIVDVDVDDDEALADDDLLSFLEENGL